MVTLEHPVKTDDRLLSIARTQQRLGEVSRTFIERLVKRGELHVIRVGHRTFIDERELSEFIEKRRAEVGG